MSYTPGKTIILSRLPAQDWFTVAEVARYSGWSENFIKNQIYLGKIPAQSYQSEADKRGVKQHQTHRVYIDDLVIFIMLNGQGRYDEKKSFGDVVAVLRPWPLWMLRELHKALSSIIEKRAAKIAAATDQTQAS